MNHISLSLRIILETLNTVRRPAPNMLRLNLVHEPISSLSSNLTLPSSDPTSPYGIWPGEVNCYETCSRARLFKRLQSSVENIHDAMSLITYNNFQHDSESFGDSCEVSRATPVLFLP
jgi:hypothetical protein